MISTISDKGVLASVWSFVYLARNFRQKRSRDLAVELALRAVEALGVLDP